MENISQENIDTLINNWGKLKIQIEKIEALISDLNNCKNDFTKTILYSTTLKLLEANGMKEKVIV